MNPLPDRWVVCAQCGSTSTSEGMARLHRRRCRSRICVDCHLVCRNPEELEEHRAGQHPTYACPECPYFSQSLAILSRHMEGSHTNSESAVLSWRILLPILGIAGQRRPP